MIYCLVVTAFVLLMLPFSSINTPNCCLIFESSRLPLDCCILGDGGRELECSLVILRAPRRGVANGSTTTGRRGIMFTSSFLVCLLCLCIRRTYLLSCKRGRRTRRRRTEECWLFCLLLWRISLLPCCCHTILQISLPW